MNIRPCSAILVLPLVICCVSEIAIGFGPGWEVLNTKWIVRGQVLSREMEGSGFSGWEEKSNIRILEVFKGDSLPSEIVVIRHGGCMDNRRYYPGSVCIYYLSESKEDVYHAKTAYNLFAGIIISDGDTDWVFKDITDYLSQRFWDRKSRSIEIPKGELLIAARLDWMVKPKNHGRLYLNTVDMYNGDNYSRKVTVRISADSTRGITKEYIENLNLLRDDLIFIHGIIEGDEIVLKSPESLIRLPQWAMTDDFIRLRSLYRYREFVKSVLEFDRLKDDMIKEADAIFLVEPISIDFRHVKFEIYHVFKGHPQLPHGKIALPESNEDIDNLFIQYIQLFAEREPKILFLSDLKHSSYRLFNGSPSIQYTIFGSISITRYDQMIPYAAFLSYTEFQDYVDEVLSKP